MRQFVYRVAHVKKLLFSSALTLAFVALTSAAQVKTSDFFELHLKRLKDEISHYQASLLRERGHVGVEGWRIKETQIILLLKQKQHQELAELYEKYKRGELPSLKDEVVKDLVALKTLAGQAVSHIGHVPVGYASQDGDLKITRFEKRNPKSSERQILVNTGERIIDQLSAVRIPLGTRYAKTAYHQTSKLRNLVAAFIRASIVKNLQSPADLNRWKDQLPREKRLALEKDLRNLPPELQLQHLMSAWIMEQNPVVETLLRFEQDKAKDLKQNLEIYDKLAVGLVLMASMLETPDLDRKAELDRAIQAIKLLDQKKSDPSDLIEKAILQESAERGDLKDSEEIAELLKEGEKLTAARLKDDPAIKESLKSLSAPIRNWLVSTIDPLRASGRARLLMMGGIERPQELRLISAISMLQEQLQPDYEEDQEKESTKRPEAEEAPAFAFEKVEEKLPAGIVPGSVEALALTGFYGAHQSSARLQQVPRQQNQLAEFRKSLGLVDTEESSHRQLEDWSYEYPEPKLQGPLFKDSSFACQTTAALSDMDLVSRQSLSLSYSYALTVAQSTLGKVPDRLYSEMLKKGIQSSGYVSPGEIASVMDRGGSLMDVLLVHQRLPTLREIDAPQNKKGEGFFPESISEFSKSVAKNSAVGHLRARIQDFAYFSSTASLSTEELLKTITQMLASSHGGPIITLSTDGRTILENWWRPVPGSMGHAANIVYMDYQVSPFDGELTLAFKVRDSMVEEPIHYWVPVKELLPYITGIAKVKSMKVDLGLLHAD